MDASRKGGNLALARSPIYKICSAPFGHESILGKSQYDKTTITGIGAYVKVLP